MVATLPVLLAVGPFGMIFGIFASKIGLDLAQTLVMTATVIAGASQLAALAALSDGAPEIIAILTGAVVNLRFAMYSASLAVVLEGAPLGWRALASAFLHDQSYALTVHRARSRPEETLAHRLGFYFGVGLLTASTWTAMTLVGATVGERIRGELDLAFMVPVTFIAVVAPMLRGRANLIAGAVAAVAALATGWLPYNLGLMVGAAAGIAAGMAASRGEP